MSIPERRRSGGPSFLVAAAASRVLAALLAWIPLGAAAATQNFDGVTAPALPAGWVAASTSNGTPIADPVWRTVTDQAHSAPNAAYVLSEGWIGRLSLTGPVFTARAHEHVRFRHRYQMDRDPNARDGGVLEISIGGSAFIDILAAGGQFLAHGYDSVINAPSNPLHSRNAWSGARPAFTETRIRLPASAAGQSVQLRWIVGTDHVGTASTSGWWIDSVQVYQAFPHGENFDATDLGVLPDAWTAQTSGGSAWTVANTSSQSPPQAAFVASPTGSGFSDRSLVSPVFTATPHQFVTFAHRVWINSLRAGGVLEYSIDGAAFRDITDGGAIVRGGYNAQVIGPSPLAGRNAWTQLPGNVWHTTTARLPTASSGRPMQLRWRLAAGDSSPGDGWWVDSIGFETRPPLTVTASVVGGGSINPAGASTVLHGDTIEFALSASPGHVLQQVDSACGGAMVDATRFRTAAVTADCTVVARFTPVFPPAEYFDSTGLDAVPLGWSVQADGGGSDWRVVDDSSHSPDRSAFVHGLQEARRDRALVSPAFVPVANQFIRFHHRYDVEDEGWDGGVLEYSINGGPFQDITMGGEITGRGYDRVLELDGNDSVLAGRNAWTGFSPGFVESIARLPLAAAGQSTRLRWRFATDSLFESTGWWVDSIELVSPRTVTVDIVGQGHASPAGPIVVANGQSTQVSFVADAGHFLRSLTSTCGGRRSGVDRFATGPINTNCTVQAEFAAGVPDFPDSEDFDDQAAGPIGEGWMRDGIGPEFWQVGALVASSAPHAAHCPKASSPTPSDRALYSPVFTIASRQVLGFRHRHEFAVFSTQAFEGGVLEIAIADAGFVDVLDAGATFLEGGYDPARTLGGPGDLTGRRSWAADSNGFVTTRVRLPEHAVGRTAQLRWRFGTVGPVFGNRTGWHIDDVALSTLAPVSVSASVQGNGSITPDGVVVRGVGDRVDFDVVAAPNHALASVEGSCGGEMIDDDTFRTTALTQDCTVVAHFDEGAADFPPGEDFDDDVPGTLPVGWSAQSSGTIQNWQVSANDSPSPPHLVSVGVSNAEGEAWLQSPPFEVQAGQVLEFQNGYILPNLPDSIVASTAAVLELSIAGGDFLPIEDAGGEFLAGGYRHYVVDPMHPLFLQRAWSGVLGSYVHTYVRMPSSAIGQSARLRWRVVSRPDTFGGDGGWLLDSIHLHVPGSLILGVHSEGPGTTLPADTQSVPFGEEIPIDIAPFPDAHLIEVESTCGGSLVDVDSFRTGPVLEDCAVLARFQSGTTLFPPSEHFDALLAPQLPLGWLALSSEAGPAVRSDTGQAHSMPHSALLPFAQGENDRSLVSPRFVPVPGQMLRFRHRRALHEIDALRAIGGAALEISIDGAAFVDIVEAGGTFLGGGYTHTMMDTGSPLDGGAVWSGLGTDFETTVVRLPDAAVGADTRLRWRLVSGVLAYLGPRLGWWVDAIELEQPSAHLLTTLATGGGGIAPSTPQIVAYGATQDLTLDPDEGSVLDRIESSCGGARTGAYTFRAGPVFENCTVTAHFVPATLPPVALSVQVSDGADHAVPGDPIEYLIRVRNDSDSAVQDLLLRTEVSPVDALVDVAWDCAPGAPVACDPASGNDMVSTRLSVPAHGEAIVTLSGEVRPFGERLLLSARIEVPSAYHDPDPTDDQATDTNGDAPSTPQLFRNGFESPP